MVLITPATDTFTTHMLKISVNYCGKLHVLLKLNSNLKHVKMFLTIKTGV